LLQAFMLIGIVRFPGCWEILMLWKWIKLSLVSIALGLPLAGVAWVALALIGF
jgi:hypothetical protein